MQIERVDEPQQIHAAMHAYQLELASGQSKGLEIGCDGGRGTDVAVTGWEIDDDERVMCRVQSAQTRNTERCVH